MAGKCRPLIRRSRLELTQFGIALILVSLEATSFGKSELWKINVDGTACQRLADTPGFRCGSPDWSPDGKWIAYDTWRLEESARDSRIAIVRADGTGAQLLGPGAMPSWSPDGKQLVLHTYDQQGGIVVMNADGTGRETIVRHWGSPRWSPRGNRIALISTERTIALFDCATGDERTIFKGPYTLRQGFAVSPDGLRFCFGDFRGGVGLATLDEQTMKAQVRWLVKEQLCYNASWGPDGRHVAVALAPDDQGGDQIYIIDVDSDDEPKRLPGQDWNQTNTNPDWSPDGKTIVFCRQPPREIQADK